MCFSCKCTVSDTTSKCLPKNYFRIREHKKVLIAFKVRQKIKGKLKFLN